MHNTVTVLNATALYILKGLRYEFYVMCILPRLKKNKTLHDLRGAGETGWGRYEKKILILRKWSQVTSMRPRACFNSGYINKGIRKRIKGETIVF